MSHSLYLSPKGEFHASDDHGQRFIELLVKFDNHSNKQWQQRNETKRKDARNFEATMTTESNQTKPNRIVSNEKRMCKHAHSTVPCIKHWLSQIEGDKLVASNDTWNNSYKHTTCCKCAWHIRCCVPSCPRPIHAECVCNDHFRLVLCEDLVRQLQFIFVCLLAITNIIEPVAPLYIVVFGHFWLPLSSIPFHSI